MRTYKIEVHSLGYEDTVLEVQAENQQKNGVCDDCNTDEDPIMAL